MQETTSKADDEVKFVVPERQQTAEEFDVRQFVVDVDQLAAALRAVVAHRAPEDFEGDRLDEMVSAVLGTMHNFTQFVGRVYHLLETVRDQMKSATEFMMQKIIEPTEWNYRYLTFKGQSLCLLLTISRSTE